MTEQSRLDLEEFEISDNSEWIKSKSKFTVKAKARELTLELN